MLGPGAQVAGYTIEEVLGHGATSTVYRATQQSVGRVVALKVLDSKLAGSDLHDRFRREARLQAGLDHPAVLPIYDAGESEHGPFIAMKLVDGSTLRSLIRRGRLDGPAALRILGVIGAALDFAHGQGLVHRDVKPQNVLVDDGGTAYLADFGLTREVSAETMTQTGAVFGTVAYLAPEVVSGEPADPASDRYAFAATAFECLTGAPPFARIVDAAVLYAHVNEEAPPISEARAELPERLDRVFARALAKGPARRFASAGQMTEAIETAFGGGALAALGPPVPPERSEERTPTPAARPNRRRRRRRGALAGGLLALGALAAAVLAFAGGERDAVSHEPSVPPIAGSAVLGSDLDAVSATPVSCEGDDSRDVARGCTLLQDELPGARLRAPADGVIRRWRVRGAEGSIALQVLRGDRGGYQEAYASAYRRILPGSTAALPSNMRIEKGDRVGVALGPGALIGVAERPGATMLRWVDRLLWHQRQSQSPRPSTALAGELMLQVELVPGGRPRQPPRLRGGVVRSQPAGEVVGTRSVVVDGRIFEISLVLAASVPQLELARGSRRIERIQIPDASAEGRLELLDFQHNSLGGQLRLQWVEPAGNTVYHEYRVTPSGFELLS